MHNHQEVFNLQVPTFMAFKLIIIKFIYLVASNLVENYY